MKRDLYFPRAARLATTKRLSFSNMSDDALEIWSIWFEEHHEQDYSDPRERSYFRVNYANLRAEIMWRNKEIPF